MAPSTIPFSTIPEIPFALRVVWFYLLVMTHTDSFSFQVDQWASLLDDLPLVSAEMHFKKNDKVCIRQVHQARSVPVSLAMLWSLIHSVILLSRLAHVWANTIYDTEYVVSKPGRRQKQSILRTPELQYIPNLSLSLTPGGAYSTEPLENNQTVCCFNS